jgi:hypothetical protein
MLLAGGCLIVNDCARALLEVGPQLASDLARTRHFLSMWRVGASRASTRASRLAASGDEPEPTIAVRHWKSTPAKRTTDVTTYIKTATQA